jgi:hypothetical protein
MKRELQSKKRKGRKTHLGDKRSNLSVEKVSRVAAMPLPKLVDEVAAGEVTCDCSDGEVGMARTVPHPVREVVVLDPFRVSSRALWE